VVVPDLEGAKLEAGDESEGEVGGTVSHMSLFTRFSSGDHDEQVGRESDLISRRLLKAPVHVWYKPLLPRPLRR